MGENKNQKLFHRYQNRLRNFYESDDVKEILSDLKNGKNTYMRVDKVETGDFDDNWINIIEDTLFDLGEIISNPKQVTKEEGNISPVELVKKTSSKTVQHLASHTQFVKDIDEKGEVIPNKLLSFVNEDDIHTYENRFIATFIRSLVLFIEKRYAFIKQYLPLKNEELLMVKNHSFVDGSEVEIETKIKIKTPVENEQSVSINKAIERLEKIREYVSFYYNSPFMKAMKTDKNVRKPIMMTNILRKNPKYHHCYEVYMYLEKYENLGVEYNLEEKYSILNEEEIDDLNGLMLFNYLSVKGKYHSKENKIKSKTYKPKILISKDDESFVYGPYLSGPVEFIRIDDKFRDYVNSKAKIKLPLHPDKRERNYYKEEYDYKKENKKDQQEIDKLLKRTDKEVEEFNKTAEEIVLLREEEEIKREKDRLLAIKEAEDALIEQKRKEIIASAKSEKEIINPNEISEEKEDEILGYYIIKTYNGYYVSDGVFSSFKHEAMIFRDFIKANRLKNVLGGKVIKL